MISTSHREFSKGQKAKAQCPICGDVILYPGLILDWRGVWVCPDCKDPRHPQENIHIYADPEALEHAQPLRDTESGAGLVRPQGVAMTSFVGQVTVVVT